MATGGILYDFAVAFKQHIPSPRLSFRSPGHDVRDKIIALVQMVCPLSWIVLDLLYVERVKNIPFAKGPLCLDIIRPAGVGKALGKRNQNPLPVFLFVHGGGWVQGKEEIVLTGIVIYIFLYRNGDIDV